MHLSTVFDCQIRVTIALAQLILQQPELVKGKRVCDIGCGLGLAGIAAALSG